MWIPIGSNSANFFELSPLRDVKQLTDSFEKLTDPGYYEAVNRDDYIGINLTNQNQIPNLMARLRKIYPNIIELKRANGSAAVFKSHGINANQIRQTDPMDLLDRFYEKITKQKLTKNQLKWAQDALKSINNGGK
nr:exonuclease SbcCD subunit D C-terminal domain-containing protein [Lactobacillus sp. Sy-1]